jgi:hypothetical protein
MDDRSWCNPSDIVLFWRVPAAMRGYFFADRSRGEFDFLADTFAP